LLFQGDLLQVVNTTLGCVPLGVFIRIRIIDPGSLRSWCIKETDESSQGKDSSAPVIHHDLSDLGSLILIRIVDPKGTLRGYHTFSEKCLTCLSKIDSILHLVSFSVRRHALIRAKCCPMIGLYSTVQHLSPDYYPVSQPPPSPGQCDVDGRVSTFKRANQSGVKFLVGFNNWWTALGFNQGQWLCGK